MNLASFLSALSLLPQLVTLVDTTVQQIETALSEFSGIAKFAAAEAKVNSVLQAVGTDADAISSVSGLIGPLINAAVAAFNAAGLFKKSSAATAA
jgi:hypothetical protein